MHYCNGNEVYKTSLKLNLLSQEFFCFLNLFLTETKISALGITTTVLLFIMFLNFLGKFQDLEKFVFINFEIHGEPNLLRYLIPHSQLWTP